MSRRDRPRAAPGGAPAPAPRTWRPWGDHPVVVIILLFCAVVSAVPYLWPGKTVPGPAQSPSPSAPSAGAASPHDWLFPEKVRLVAYEERVPILDNTLFLGRYYTDLVLGGVNLAQVDLAARSKLGDAVTCEWDPSHRWMKLPYRDDPVIEMRYGMTHFRIETIVDAEFAPTITLSRLSAPSLRLRPATEYQSGVPANRAQ